MLMSLAFLASALVQFALGLLMAAMLGPVEFGRYAIAFAASVIAYTLLFEWIRLSITRYHRANPRVAQRLKRLQWTMGGLGLLLVPIAYLLGGELNRLAVAVILTGIVWGVSECRGAALRAEFEERRFAIFLLMRTGLTLIIMPIAAWLRPEAEIILSAFILSVLLSLGLQIVTSPKGTKTASSGSLQDVPPLRVLSGYAMPIVATNLAYLLLFFVLRLFVAVKIGMGEAGSFSLALDLNMKLVMTMGTALDLFLFQLAVQREKEGGPDAGRLQIGANAALVLALLAPAVIGLVLIVPSIEALVIAPGYRETFDFYAIALAPGFLLFGLAQYAIHPAHQIEQRTLPLILAGASALAGAFTLLAISSVTRMGYDVIPSIALGIGMVGALLVLWGTLPAPIPVAWSRLLPRLIACLVPMVIVVLALRSVMEPGLILLVVSAISGAIVFAVPAWVLNLAEIRSIITTHRAKKNGA